MKSRISIDFDRVSGGHGKEPLINVNLIRSDDAKDKLLDELVSGKRYLQITHTGVSGDPIDRPSKMDIVHPKLPIFDLWDLCVALTTEEVELQVWDNKRLILTSPRGHRLDLDIEEFRYYNIVAMINFIQEKIKELLKTGSQKTNR